MFHDIGSRGIAASTTALRSTAPTLHVTSCASTARAAMRWGPCGTRSPLHTTPGIPEHKVPEVALVTAGVEYDVLAEKPPGYVRPNFCAIIRGSTHST
jgi:hypothetical protein